MTTAVALFVFNRPQLARQALERLAAIGASRLLVIADGPRTAKDASLCEQTRRVVRDAITWNVDVEFSESAENLGCRRRIESGLDWVFDRVDEAIVLEDDIEVSPTFFDFAAYALERFAATPAVRMISGHNKLLEYPGEPLPFLSRNGSIWGWATWASRWRDYRHSFARQPAEAVVRGIERYAVFDVQARLQRHLFESRFWEKIDTWDMPWSIWNLSTGGYCLNVPRNQSVNHGLGRDATHTTDEDDLRGNLPLRPWTLVPGALEVPAALTAYDRAETLLELVLNYDEPRRWKVLSRRRDKLPRPASGPGWEIMLSPFDHAAETGKTIAHLRQYISGRQLDDLAEIFPAA
jgi:hypothetical protein